jgi:ferredoxin
MSNENKNYRVEHDREICIGCSACASVCPKYWTMATDGKSNLEGHTETSDGNQFLGTKENPLTEDFESNMDAAESCPVNCIHVFEVKEDGTEKDLI